MKPGMTRWKMVPLYWPFFTYFRKFSTVRGAAWGSSSNTITPMDVVSFTWGLGPALRAATAKDRRAAIKGRIGISQGDAFRITSRPPPGLLAPPDRGPTIAGGPRKA